MPVQKHWAIKLSYQEWVALVQCKFKMKKEKKKSRTVQIKRENGEQRKSCIDLTIDIGAAAQSGANFCCASHTTTVFSVAAKTRVDTKVVLL